MKRDEIAAAVALTMDAKTDHEDARDWYDSYGWHLATERAGDITLDACAFDWLDDDEGVVAAQNLMREHEGLTADEADCIAQMAHTVRQAAESICGLLDEAVAAYEARDIERCRAALLAAYDQESEHGDSPAAQTLAGALLVADTDERAREMGETTREAVRGYLERYCAMYAADQMVCSVEHSSGGAPRPHLGEKWKDPADLVSLIPPPTVEQAIAELDSIPYDDDDEEAARRCIERYLESHLWEACDDNTPTRSIADICVNIEKP